MLVKTRRFWLTLLPVLGVVYAGLGLGVTELISEDPAWGGAEVTGFPFTVQTSGSCAEADTCQPFSWTMFIVDFIILSAIGVATACEATRHGRFGAGLKNVAAYLGGWAAVLLAAVALLFAAVWAFPGVPYRFVSVLSTASIIYNAAYFYGDVRRALR